MLICRIRSRSSPSSCWRRTRFSASSLARDLKSERSAYASSLSHSAMRRQRTQFYATCHTDRIFGNDRSEYPAVVIPFSTHHYLMLRRNLVYTGITRAKKLVVSKGKLF